MARNLTVDVVAEARRIYIKNDFIIFSCPALDMAGHRHGWSPFDGGDAWALYWLGRPLERGHSGYWLDHLDWDHTGCQRKSHYHRRALRIRMFDAYLSNDEVRIDTLRRRIRGIDT